MTEIVWVVERNHVPEKMLFTWPELAEARQDIFMEECNFFDYSCASVLELREPDGTCMYYGIVETQPYRFPDEIAAREWRATLDRVGGGETVSIVPFNRNDLVHQVLYAERRTP